MSNFAFGYGEGESGVGCMRLVSIPICIQKGSNHVSIIRIVSEELTYVRSIRAAWTVRNNSATVTTLVTARPNPLSSTVGESAKNLLASVTKK